ncbi:flavin reductase like domain-containing protein [Paraphysoderma sedebokerense]|nr:flavin reductase like domain-containing protein [Paraphysoderma sedebokerense]
MLINLSKLNTTRTICSTCFNSIRLISSKSSHDQLKNDNNHSKPALGTSLRHLMRRLAFPVAIVSASSAPKKTSLDSRHSSAETAGSPYNIPPFRLATISSFSSVSLSPPIVSFNLQIPSRMSDTLRSSPHFLLHILSHRQSSVSEFFARKVDYDHIYSLFSKSSGQKLSISSPNNSGIHFGSPATEVTLPIERSIPSESNTISLTWSKYNIPMINGCVGVLKCEKQDSVIVGDHEVFFGKVTDVLVDQVYSEVGRSEMKGADNSTQTPSEELLKPLLYCNRKYTSVEDSILDGVEGVKSVQKNS